MRKISKKTRERAALMLATVASDHRYLRIPDAAVALGFSDDYGAINLAHGALSGAYRFSFGKAVDLSIIHAEAEAMLRAGWGMR